MLRVARLKALCVLIPRRRHALHRPLLAHVQSQLLHQSLVRLHGAPSALHRRTRHRLCNTTRLPLAEARTLGGAVASSAAVLLVDAPARSALARKPASLPGGLRLLWKSLEARRRLLVNKLEVATRGAALALFGAVRRVAQLRALDASLIVLLTLLLALRLYRGVAHRLLRRLLQGGPLVQELSVGPLPPTSCPCLGGVAAACALSRGHEPRRRFPLALPVLREGGHSGWRWRQCEEIALLR